MDLLTPRTSPNSALPLHTQKQCNARGSSWSLPLLSLTTKGSWIHLSGEVRQATRQLSDARTPNNVEKQPLVLLQLRQKKASNTHKWHRIHTICAL